MMRILLLLLSLIVAQKADAFSLSDKPVSTLLKDYSAQVSDLKVKAAETVSNPPQNDVFYLRYCLSDDPEECMKAGLEWQSGEGKAIFDAARSAVEKATASGGWDNEPVRDAAPHAASINKFITPSQVLTTSSRQGDLVYCVRAGKIDDKELMSEVSVDDMVEFFLYCKQVNALVADMRSITSDHLVSVLLANDLNGVKMIGGDSRFRSALSAASKKANGLFPQVLNGPTLLLNLPPLFGALVKLFTPLFPEDVRRRIRFEQGPLKKVDDLSDISGKSPAVREQFLSDLDKLVYSD